jgi:phosphatidylserine/phosphatidylglycerophosphate/cardiolipin synthase-like enzyme
MAEDVRYVADCEAILREFRTLIEAAEHSIILQMYLFAANAELEVLLPRRDAPAHAELVAGWLLEKRRRHPDLPIAVILDTNTPSEAERTRKRETPLRTRLERAGIAVLHANLFDNAFDRSRSFSKTKNFHLTWESCPASEWRARHNRWQVRQNVEDHRKNLVIDCGRAGLITSHNLCDMAHDWYENAFVLRAEPAQELWNTATRALACALTLPHALTPSQHAELADLSRTEPLAWPSAQSLTANERASYLVHSSAIRAEVATLINQAGQDDTLYVASAYFSDCSTFDLLAQAARRGSSVRVLIDSIAGLPLPQHLSWVIRSLVNHAVTRRARERTALTDNFEFRVHDSSHGRLMHLKTCAVFGERSLLIGGQANFTPNSFSGAWLETDVVTRDREVLAAFKRHFDELWALAESKPLSTTSFTTGLTDRARDAALWAFRQVGLEP